MPTKFEQPYSDRLEQELNKQIRGLIGGNDPIKRSNIRKARSIMKKWPSWMDGEKGVWERFIAVQESIGMVVS